MNRVIETNWWCMDLPEEWEADEDPEDGVVIITDDDDVSTIEISALMKDGGKIEASEVLDFASDLTDQGFKPEKVSCGDFEGLLFNYVDEEGAWREWFVASGSVILFISHFSDVEHRTFDDQAIDVILSTLAVSKQQTN